MPSAAPQKIGRYRIVGRLGKGAMAVVYRAHDDVMGRPVAIKVMMADLEEDPETSARFYREARAAGQLVHRNIITIFDMGEDDGRPYIVMELLEGPTLGEYLKGPHASDLERNLDLMIQICEGLQVAHAHGIYHRDVKPSNLVVSEDGLLKILDFGIARLSSSNLTASGLIVGTPDYMSPEQARGQDVDERSDIFSAGAVFYFMVTGRKPFAAGDLPGVLRKVEAEDPLPIRDTEAPPALARIVMTALAKSPSERYQHAAQLIADLRRVRRDLEIRAKQLIEEATGRLAAIASALVDRKQICERLTVAPQEQDEALLERLVKGRSALETWPATTPHLESLGLAAVTDLLREICRVDEVLSAEMANLREAESAFQDGTRAANAGDWRLALERFEAASQVLPYFSPAIDEAARCRRQLLEQQAIDDRVASLQQQAQDAAGAAEWQTVIVLCDEALVVKSDAPGVVALRERAVRSLDLEKRARTDEAGRALDRADKLRREGKFNEAELELARARGSDPNSPRVAALAEQLQASRLDAQRASERDRKTAQAITAARATFMRGERQTAVNELRAFLARDPHILEVKAEIDRLEAESTRLQLVEQRLAEATRDARAAETALEAGEPEQALKLAAQALAADSSHKLAQKISGLAAARLREQAQAKARAEEAAVRLREAADLLRLGKYEKARRTVNKAAQLTPASEDVSALLAQINAEEAQAALERERTRLAQLRAQAAAPIIAMARAAEARNDFVRALWTAENALALDLDCPEAREILQRAKARLDEQPALADETVDTLRPKGDPEDTVSLGGHTSPLQRLASIIRRWVKREPSPWGPAGDGPRVRQ
jgi:tRNA A-37 threonylcarbamoyl transferase component Bud32/tetratricopeptide (TPR) repeat protein